MNTTKMDNFAARVGAAEGVDVKTEFRIRRNVNATHSSTHYATWTTGLQASKHLLEGDVRKLSLFDFDILLGQEFDLWHPTVRPKGYGPALMAMILATPRPRVTIVTSQAAVTEDITARHSGSGRLNVTFRLGLPPGRDDVRRAIDPFGSPIDARYSAMRLCRRAGIRVTALIDGILPGIGDGPEDIDRLVVTLRDIGVEELRFAPLQAYDTRTGPYAHRLARAGLANAATNVQNLYFKSYGDPFWNRVNAHVKTAVVTHGVTDKLSIMPPRSYYVSHGVEVSP